MERNRVEMQAQRRTVVGKKVRHLRRQGLIPGHVYGRGPTLTVQIEAKALQSVLSRAGLGTLISLQVDGATHSVVVRDVERAPRNGALLHVDLQEVALDEPIRTRVPIVLVGESPAAKGDTMVLRGIDHVNLEGLPAQLPPAVQVDLSQIAEPDQVLHASDLDLPEGVRLLDDPAEVVARLTAAPAEEVVTPPEEEEEEAPLPEVPGAKEE